MDKFLKKSRDVTNYGHCIIKEELNISDSDEEVDVETVDEPIDKIPTSQISRKSDHLRNRNISGDNKVQATLDFFLKSENTESSDEQHENSNESTKDKKSKCDKTLTYRKKLVHHHKTHRNTVNQSLQLQCSKCGKEFKRLDHRKQHEKVCGKEATYKCRQCSFSARYKSNLTSHVKEKHSGFTAKCKNCTKVFTNQRSLKRHLNVYCNKTKLLECDHCGHKFYRKDQMVKHLEQLHSTDYQDSRSCKYCGMALDRYEHVRFHLERCESAILHFRYSSETTKQPNIGEAFRNLSKAYCMKCNTKRPVKYRVRRCSKCDALLKFSCEMCSKSFADSNLLREHLRSRHLKTLTLYRCDKCRCSYNRKKNLMKHQRDCHSLEQTTSHYECSKCGKEYKNQQSLKKHEISCSQEPKFYCYKCSYKTHFKSCIISHFRAKRATCV